jgi:hypothetical protein
MVATGVVAEIGGLTFSLSQQKVLPLTGVRNG